MNKGKEEDRRRREAREKRKIIEATQEEKTASPPLSITPGRERAEGGTGGTPEGCSPWHAMS